MRLYTPYAALAAAFAMGAPAASAQTWITSQVIDTPVQTVVMQPVRTVQTIETVRTVPVVRTVVQRRVVATQRVYTRPAVRTVVATGYRGPLYNQVVAAPAPVVRYQPAALYDAVVPSPAPVVSYDYGRPYYDYGRPYYDRAYYDYGRPYYDYGRPLYDTVVAAPAPVVATTPVVATAPIVSVGAVVPQYNYVYQPDRILVIDPASDTAIQAIPR